MIRNFSILISSYIIVNCWKGIRPNDIEFLNIRSSIQNNFDFEMPELLFVLREFIIEEKKPVGQILSPMEYL